MTDTAVLNMLTTGSNETEEARFYDNQTSLNVTSPYLNSFYFYKVSHLHVNWSFDTYVNQPMSVNIQTIDRLI
jgi:hypothetical protein